MATITLSLPDKLKTQMEKVDMINWSSVARRAFVEQLKDFMQLQKLKKVREISEIDEDDDRDFNEEYKKELLKITKNSPTGPLRTPEEFNDWCNAL